MKYSLRKLTALGSGVLFILMLTSSCTPGSKDSYLEEFDNFIDEVEAEAEIYTAEDWEDADRKFDQFTGEWYYKFSDKFTLRDELLIAKHKITYSMLKAGSGTKDFYEEFMQDDFEALKNQVRYYIENDMHNDLQFLKEQAQDLGATAAETLEDIMEELEEELDE